MSTSWIKSTENRYLVTQFNCGGEISTISDNSIEGLRAKIVREIIPNMDAGDRILIEGPEDFEAGDYEGTEGQDRESYHVD